MCAQATDCQVTTRGAWAGQWYAVLEFHTERRAATCFDVWNEHIQETIIARCETMSTLTLTLSSPGGCACPLCAYPKGQPNSGGVNLSSGLEIRRACDSERREWPYLPAKRTPPSDVLFPLTMITPCDGYRRGGWTVAFSFGASFSGSFISACTPKSASFATS